MLCTLYVWAVVAYAALKRLQEKLMRELLASWMRGEYQCHGSSNTVSTCFNCSNHRHLEDQAIQGPFYWQPLSLGPCYPWAMEEENQKLKEMIQSLGAGRTVDAQTFEDLGRKPGPPVRVLA